MERAVILWVDGNNLAWRALHVGTHLDNGMSYVFLNALHKTIRTITPRRCVVCWDGGLPEFRLQLLPTYKGARRQQAQSVEQRPAREEFKGQLRWLMNTLRLLGVEQLWAHGWEADDAIAHGVLQTGPHTILTGDRDLWQLVTHNVSIYTPKHEIIRPETFAIHCAPHLGKWATPRLWLLYRVLTGDKSDGIPGVGGVGPKRARALIYTLTKNNQNASVSGFKILEPIYRYLRTSNQPWLHGRRRSIWAAVHRNWQLMDLSVAVGLYTPEEAARATIILPTPSVTGAVERLAEKKMWSLDRSWLAPFLKLAQ